MKKIGLVIRNLFDGHNCQHDALDRNWYPFLNKCNIIPIFLPNDLNLAKKLIENIKLDGFILTGGGDIGQDEPRAFLEKYILDYSSGNSLPIIGICRGLQAIQNYFGISQEKIENHVKTIHKVEFNNISRNSAWDSFSSEESVNSYHNYGTFETNDKIKIIARAPDGVVEALEADNIFALMWHPERDPFNESNIKFFKSVYGIK